MTLYTSAPSLATHPTIQPTSMTDPNNAGSIPQRKYGFQMKDIPPSGTYTFTAVKVGADQSGEPMAVVVIDSGPYAKKSLTIRVDDTVKWGGRFQAELAVATGAWKRGTTFAYKLHDIRECPPEIVPEWVARTNSRFVRDR